MASAFNLEEERADAQICGVIRPSNGGVFVGKNDELRILGIHWRCSFNVAVYVEACYTALYNKWKIVGFSKCADLRSRMALLLRLRQAFVRSSSIPKYCSFPPFASDSSHLISLSKTLFPTASRQQNSRSLSTPCRTQIEGSLASSKYLSVEDAKGIQEIFDKFKKSCLEMIEQLKCTCIREKSVEDSIVIEEMSVKLKKSCLVMIEQLKDMLGFVLVSPNLDIDCKDTKFEGDKCGNEVITPRLPSPHTECENQLSVEDMEMIDEMSEKLTKYIEVLDKLKVMHGFTSHSCDFYIDRKIKKPEEDIHGGPVYAHLDSHIYPVKMKDATTAC